MGTCIAHRQNVKSRKDHKCFGCDKVMCKGTISDVTVCVEDGEAYSVRLCAECIATEKELRGEEWFQGDLGEYRKEAERDRERELEREVKWYIECKGW